MSTYQSFPRTTLQDDEDTDENEDNLHEAGVLIHVPESDRSKWSPIEDLDSFFRRVYKYHQKHGFVCMILQDFLELGQFVFVVIFSVFLFHCVNYPILFRDEIAKNKNSTKVSIKDAILPWEESKKSMGVITWISIIVAIVFWCWRLVNVLIDCIQYWDIKCFYNNALNISDGVKSHLIVWLMHLALTWQCTICDFCDIFIYKVPCQLLSHLRKITHSFPSRKCFQSELDNLTWHEVQRRLRLVQKEHEMCIHKKDLTELDIYHRILRFENYMVALVNKNLLPVHLRVPFIGNVVFFTRGLKYNIELLLFRKRFPLFSGVFVNNWHLKEDYKKVAKRKELAENLSRHILWIVILNFFLCPLIFLWQILHSFFTYAEMIKREPESLGSRCWSLHGRLYLRHFNELDHELNARLNRAYRPATKYMNIFTSPVMTVVAKNVGFVSGAILAVLVALTIYDEDVITVEHVLTAITVLGGILAASRVFIPDENLVWCPEQLMTAVLAHVHYLPESWRGQAHTQPVRSQFSQIFQYKAEYLIQELISPLVTPYVLLRKLRPRAIDIVDFFRQFTIEVVGVGDVCSFAQMDIRKHGNPDWQPDGEPRPERRVTAENPQYAQAEDGKTELSLIHFTLTNPNWRPPADAENFVGRLKAQAMRDAEMLEINTAGFNNPLCTSLHSISSLGVGYNIFATSFLRQTSRSEERSEAERRTEVSRFNPFNMSQSYQNYNGTSMSQSIKEESAMRGGISRTEGPGRNDRGDILGADPGTSSGPQSLGCGLRGIVNPSTSLGASVFGSGPDIVLYSDQTMEQTPADMALSTLYLHELHHRQVRRKGNLAVASGESSYWGGGRAHQGMPGIQERQTDESVETQRKNEKLPLLKK